MFRAHSRARHARIAIRVGKIDVAADKDVLIIRAARRENQRVKTTISAACSPPRRNRFNLISDF